MTTLRQRIRVRIDRLPGGRVIVLVGFLVQLALAAGLLMLAYVQGDGVGLLVSGFLVGVVVLAGVAALPSVLLLGRYPRVGAALAVLAGAAILVVNDATPTVWPFSIALFVAAVRVWAGSGLDTMALLELDPGRFERVEPTDDGGRGDGRSDTGDSGGSQSDTGAGGDDRSDGVTPETNGEEADDTSQGTTGGEAEGPG